MEKIKDFMKKVTESLEPFEISDDQWTYSFMQRKVGKAKYIYMINSLYRSIQMLQIYLQLLLMENIYYG